MEFGYHYTKILTASTFGAYLVKRVTPGGAESIILGVICRTNDKERWAVASVGFDPIPDGYKPSFEYDTRQAAIDALEEKMRGR